MHTIEFFIPYLPEALHPNLCYKQELIWKMLVQNIHHKKSTLASKITLIKPYSCSVKAPDCFSIINLPSEDFYDERVLKASALLDVLKKSVADFVGILAPDVFIKPNINSTLEIYLDVDHDAVSIATHIVHHHKYNALNQYNLDYEGRISASTRYFDTAIIKKDILQNFEVADAVASIPPWHDIVNLNIKRHAVNPKFLYEPNVAMRYNNQRYWLRSQYASLIKKNHACLKGLIDSSSEMSIEPIELRMQKYQHVFVSHNPFTPVDFNTIPKKLDGEMWGIATFFASENSKLLKDNFDLFATNCRRQGLKLLTIELTPKSEKGVLSPSNSDMYIHLQTDVVLWHKERLFNYAVSKLPKECDKVVFLDADILFENENWIAETRDLLEKYAFIQPFEYVHRMVELEKDISKKTEFGSKNGEKIHSIAYGLHKYGQKALDMYPHHGVPGMALACRRDLIEDIGYYDADITGSGDLLLIDSLFNIETLRIQFMNQKFKQHFFLWRKKLYKAAKNSLYFTSGDVFHLWHGDTLNRFYEERETILARHNFDPSTDIRIAENGTWDWSKNKMGLHQEVQSYFKNKSSFDSL